MTDDRMSGLALIAGSIASIITMALHPTGHDLLSAGQSASIARLTVAVHALALVSLPIVFLGACGLTRRLAGSGEVAFAALVTYGFALVAVMNAAVISGLIGPRVVSQILTSRMEAGPASDLWQIIFRYSGYWNQAFALVYVVASSMAILLWSIVMVRSRARSKGLGIYGVILAPVTMMAVLSGHLRLDVHGFGAVVLGQTVWFVLAGARLMETELAAASPSK